MVAPLRIGLAGLGTVGAAVARLIEQEAGSFPLRCGRPVEVVAVTARSRSKKRDLGSRSLRWASDPVALATDPGVDVLV